MSVLSPLPPRVLKSAISTLLSTQVSSDDFPMRRHNTFWTGYTSKRVPKVHHISMNTALYLEGVVHFYSYTRYRLLHTEGLRSRRDTTSSVLRTSLSIFATGLLRALDCFFGSHCLQ
jgi:hypothetical protein